MQHMKRATMVTLKITNIMKIKELGLNLSNLLDILLTKHIAESELTQDNLTEWFKENTRKSEEAWKKHQDGKVVIYGAD